MRLVQAVEPSQKHGDDCGMWRFSTAWVGIGLTHPSLGCSGWVSLVQGLREILGQRLNLTAEGLAPSWHLGPEGDGNGLVGRGLCVSDWKSDCEFPRKRCGYVGDSSIGWLGIISPSWSMAMDR